MPLGGVDAIEIGFEAGLLLTKRRGARQLGPLGSEARHGCETDQSREVEVQSAVWWHLEARGQ